MASLVVCLAGWVEGQSLEPVSTINPGQSPPGGGSGDSVAPIMSPDGRFVLFASTANNLVLATNHLPMPGGFPPSLNVFLRDRLNRTTSLVSVNLSRMAGGNGDSLPLGVSTNGRYALFESSASDLVPDDTNNVTDLFLRDLVTSSTILVNANTSGTVGNGASRSAALTPDGRYVAFVSAASDLLPGDTNGIPDVFVRDVQAGTTTLASVGALSPHPTRLDGSSEAPDITPDGRYVAFYSTATNLVSGAGLTGEIYVRDLVSGTTTWVSAGAGAAVQAAFGQSNMFSFNHAISADGKYVAYEAKAASNNVAVLLRYNLATSSTEVVHTNAAVQLVPSPEFINSLDMSPDGRFIAFIANTNVGGSASTCLYVWDAQSGGLTLASGDPNNQVPPGSTCDWPSLTPDGRYVAFLSSAPGLVTNAAPGPYHLYVRDLQSGSTSLVDVDTNGVGSVVSPATAPSMSVDGRLVAFDAGDGSLVPNDCNRDVDVFLRDLSGGTTELISAHDAAFPSVTPNGPSSLTLNSTTRDGRFLVFASAADNLIPNDTNGCRDIFLRDLVTGATTLVSAATNGFSADGISSEPAITPDGRYVVFSSIADNLVAGDTNQAQDVFVRDLQTGSTVLVSVNKSGTGPGNGDSYSPTISSDGRFVLYRSKATNLTGGAYNSDACLLRDLQKGTNWALPQQAALPAAMTPDGRFVFFGLMNEIGMWDSETGNVVFSYYGVGIWSQSRIATSPDGRLVVFSGGVQPTGILYITSVAEFPNSSNTPPVIIDQGNEFRNLSWSSDARFLAYERRAGTFLYPTNEVRVYDVVTGKNTLVNHTSNSSSYACAADSPCISPDGRFVAFRSIGTNLVAGITNARPAVYLYEVATGINSLLAEYSIGGTLSRKGPLTLVFSGDSRMLFFASWAADLVANDFNQNSDVFGYSFLNAVLLPASTARAGTLDWLALHTREELPRGVQRPPGRHRLAGAYRLNSLQWQQGVPGRSISQCH